MDTINKDIEMKNLKDLSNLRDRLIREKTLAESQQEKTREAVNTVKKVIESIPSEIIDELKETMPEVIGVFNPDFDKLLEDDDYLEDYKSSAMILIQSIRTRLTGLLEDSETN